MGEKIRPHKKNFWIFAIFFSFLTVTGLALLWADPPPSGHHSFMMGSTMGLMMAEHGTPVTLGDLFQQGEVIKSSQIGSGMSDHHGGNTLMGGIHFVTTVIIVTLLPLIIGGLAFLIAMWL